MKLFVSSSAKKQKRLQKLNPQLFLAKPKRLLATCRKLLLKLPPPHALPHRTFIRCRFHGVDRKKPKRLVNQSICSFR
jgi:hypothetical protein